RARLSDLGPTTCHTSVGSHQRPRSNRRAGSRRLESRSGAEVCSRVDRADRTGGTMKIMRHLALMVVITLSLGGYAWASSPTEQLRAYTDQVMKALENPPLTASERLEAV